MFKPLKVILRESHTSKGRQKKPTISLTIKEGKFLFLTFILELKQKFLSVGALGKTLRVMVPLMLLLLFCRDCVAFVSGRNEKEWEKKIKSLIEFCCHFHTIANLYHCQWEEERKSHPQIAVIPSTIIKQRKNYYIVCSQFVERKKRRRRQARSIVNWISFSLFFPPLARSL